MKHLIPEFLKKAGLAAMLTIMPAAGFAQEEIVKVLAKDGSSFEFAISGIYRINFGAQTIDLVEKNGTASSLAYNDIDRILIGDNKSGINHIAGKGNIAIYPSVTTGPLTIAGLEAGTEVELFDIKGVSIVKTTAKDSSISLNIADAPKGVVIVKVGKHSTKIFKK